METDDQGLVNVTVSCLARHRQGDQCEKNHPKCSPTFLLSKLINNFMYTVEKCCPKYCNFCNLLKKNYSK
jgi:hypothetical protein